MRKHPTQEIIRGSGAELTELDVGMTREHTGHEDA